MPSKKTTEVALEKMIAKLEAEEALGKVIAKLEKAVKRRNIAQALKIVDECIGQLETLPLSLKGMIPLLWYCAWAIDYQDAHLLTVEKAIVRFKELPLGTLTLCDLALMNVAEGLVKFHREEYAVAKTLFEQVQADADRAQCTEMMIVSRYYQGRVLWKQADDYDKALEFVRDAAARDLELNDNQPRVAAMELVEGWLVFLKGKIPLAQEVLNRARARLTGSEDHLVDLGNVISFQGRLYREKGPEHYWQALACFSEANLIYAQDNLGHRNMARTHLNAAFVYRLLARDIDRRPASQDCRPQAEAQVKELRDKAFAELKSAREIYDFDQTRHARGLGKLHNALALLYLDSCEFDRAEHEAEVAFAHGKTKNDKIVMADARIIQSTVALERSAGYGAQEAFRLARQAIELAKQTDHRRLRARAYIREGLALLEPPYADPIGAERSLHKAQAKLVEADQDYLRGSLNALDKGIQSQRNVVSFASRITIANLERCRLEGRSLEDLSAERDEEIIRFVYKRCGGNIEKTARELKTGAKKVRKATYFFKITQAVLETLKREQLADAVVEKLATLKNKEIQGRAVFIRQLKKRLDSDYTDLLEGLIFQHVNPYPPEPF